MPPAISTIRNTEHAVNAAYRTTDAGADRATDCAAHRPRCTVTLVCALVGTALHAIEDALGMGLMRNGK
jgi:hypothetical protein